MSQSAGCHQSLGPRRLNQNLDVCRNYYRDSAERPACDNQCRRNILCQQLQGRSRDTAPCQVIWRLFDEAHPTSAWWQLFLGRLSGTYV